MAKKWAIYGSKGWIGGMVVKFLGDLFPNDEVYCSEIRVDNTSKLTSELNEVKPTHVISLVGRTHGPGFSTIDYLEQPGKLIENVRDNLYGPLTLAMLCKERGIHLTYMGTGCIFTYDSDGEGEHTLSAGERGENGFTEDDVPNYFDSSYSVVKGFSDRLMHLPLLADTVLNVRIRMPIVSTDHPRNFISKIIRYKKICSVANSMSVLDELLPLMIAFARDRVVGTINLTNPGTITHNRILDLYKEIIDPSFTYENFSVEEQRKVLMCGRSNNLLDTTRLEELCRDDRYSRFCVRGGGVRPIEEAVIETLRKWER